MHEFFDFLGTPTGSRLLGIVGNLLTIVAALISGKALQNTVQLKKAIGGTIERGLLEVVRDVFRRGGRRRRTSSATVDGEALTLDQKVDLLQATQERMWTNNGRQFLEINNAIDKIKPAARRRGEPEDD